MDVRSRKKDRKEEDAASKPKSKVSLSFGEDTVSPEIKTGPPPPRERLVNMLTTYTVDPDKEVYNIKVSSKVLQTLTPQEIRDLRVIFDAFDCNKDGLLPLPDVRRALLALGFKTSKGEVRNMMSDADLGDTNGEANFNTFLEFVIDKQGDSRDNIDELEKSFKLFDIERTGKLTIDTLLSLCRQFNVSIKDEDVVDMVRLADSNGDGSIDKKEFTNIMLKTNLFL